MSITPHQLNLLTSPVVELYQALEVEILKQIARRMRVTGEATITEYQLKKLSQLHLLNRDIADTLSEMSGIATERIKSAIHEAGYRMNKDTDEYMRRAGKELLPTPPIEPLMESYVKQTFREINNFVNQTLIDTHFGQGTVSKMYEQMVTESVAKVASGLMTLEQATEDTVLKWAEKGVPSTFIDKGGHTWSMERYVRTVLKSTNSRIYNELRTSRMSEYGVYTVLVSSKPKARPACAHCQGKVIDIRPIGEADSEYPSAYEFGYGEPGGHRGINCGHSWFPFIPGVNVNNQVQYDPKKAIEAERIEQERKELARRIVKTKKLLTVTKELKSEGANHYSEELRRLQGRMAEFVKKHNLKRDYRLEKVYTPKETLMKDYAKHDIIGLRTVDGLEIKDVSRHYFDRVFERKIDVTQVKDALLRPIETSQIKVDKDGKSSKRYYGADTTVVVNPDTGKVITVHKTRKNIRKRNGAYNDETN